MNRRRGHRTTWPAAACALAVGGLHVSSSEAQPCSGYEPEELAPELLEHLMAEVNDGRAQAADAAQPPSKRLAGARRIVEAGRAIDSAYGICDVPADRDLVAFHDATGLSLTAGDDDVERAGWEACRKVVAEVHAAGPEAAECLSRDDTVRAAVGMLAPAPPAEWSSADADESAAFFAQALTARGAEPDDREARLALAAMQRASGDFQGTLDELADLGEALDVGLLRAAAWYGLGHSHRALRQFLALAEAYPQEPEPHFNVGSVATWMAWSGHAQLTEAVLEQGLLHAEAFLCLTDTHDDPELADSATLMLERILDRLEIDTAWNWSADHEQPRLPLPWRELGPEAQRTFERGRPAATTCRQVLRRIHTTGSAPATVDP